jgi:hypothetical protein
MIDEGSQAYVNENEGLELLAVIKVVSPKQIESFADKEMAELTKVTTTLSFS